MARTRVVLARLGLVAFGLVVAWLAAELLLGLRQRTTALDADAAPEERQQAASWVYHPTPWTWPFPSRTVDLPAGLQAFSYETGTGAAANSQGFRTDEYTTAHPPRTCRIVVLGDSITWGQGVALEDTFAARLEEQLRPRLAAVGLDVEVIAIGVPGARLIDHVIRLHAHVAALQPDLVVLQYFPNDVEYYDDLRQEDPLAAAEEHSEVLKLIHQVQLRDLFWRQLAAWIEPTSLSWRLYTEGIAEIAGWSRSSGTPVVVAAFPPSDQRPDGGNFDGFRGLAEFQPLLEPPLEALEAAGLPLLRVVEAYRHEAGREFLCVSPEDGHPNARAHAIVAAALAAFLTDGGWLPAGPDEVHPGGAGWAEEAPLRRRAAAEWDALNRDYAAQRGLYDQLLAQRPDDPWMVAQAARERFESGDHAGARNLYARLPELAPDVASPWFHLARCTDDLAQRCDLLQRMLAVVPDHAPSVEDLMWRRRELGDTAETCRLAVRLTGIARYPEQLHRAQQLLVDDHCSEATP